MVQQQVLSRADDLISLSHRLQQHPETAFEEHRAAAWLTEVLDDAGFTVERGVADLPTAFMATYGSGSLTVGVCAEYDALPAIGHACGHNIIAGSALGTGLALRAVADELDLTVKVLGTPAEEGGGGKVVMIEKGLFDDLHAALMIHPTPRELVAPDLLAMSARSFEFQGREAHAASFPEAGINAMDALTVAQVSIGLLRQHILDDERIHGVPEHGYEAANVIPSHARANYVARAASRERLEVLVDRLTKCFEAGALATGATLTIDTSKPAYLEMKHDPLLMELYRVNAENLGRRFRPLQRGDSAGYASTDFGNVSHHVPAIIPTVDIGSGAIGNHEPEFADCAVTPTADKALLDGAVAMAWTVIDTAADAVVRTALSSARDARIGV
ncbi:M20 family peptidase [Geodermatophilus sp. DF01-2]|nr:M20 family peptidase [Geodermatophilus sp. DF01_2]